MSKLAKVRSISAVNIGSWTYMSVLHWDEPAAGTWTLNVADARGSRTGTWQSYQVKIYGEALVVMGVVLW